MRDAFSLKIAACHDNYMILHAGFLYFDCNLQILSVFIHASRNTSDNPR